MNEHQTDTPTVVYANDPLCGWCFAIGPELDAARQRLGDSVRWRIACGGLVVGDRVRPIGLDRDYLRAGLAQVEQVSGRRAGDRYYANVVDPGTWVSASEPACRAVLLVQQRNGDLAIDFSHRLADALYLDGRVPDDIDTLVHVAELVGVAADELVADLHSPETLAMTQREFAAAKQLGVTTYPSLFLDASGGLVPLLDGYATADAIEAAIVDALAATPVKGR